MAVRLNYINTKLSEEDYARSSVFVQTANDLRYYDEVLTLSASMATVDDYLAWEQRYQDTARLLDSTIQSASNPSTDTTLAILSQTNNKMVAMEESMFAALRLGDQQQAISIIKSEQYALLKKDYADCITKLTGILHQQSERTIAEIQAREIYAGWLRKTGLFFVVLIWISVAYNTRKLNQLLHQSNLKFSKLAYFDQLTGIANRTLLMDRLQQSLRHAKRDANSGALFIIDLDNFKAVNDSLGHPIGDKLLAIVARRLTETCRKSDTVARLGGDEFAVVARSIVPLEQTSVLAEKILAALHKPIELGDHSFSAQASIGIALFPSDADQEDELLRKADLALYKSKALGKNIYSYFDNEIEISAKNRQCLEQEIHHGIDNNEFELFYQPIVRLSDQVITGVEALIRWHHPTHGFVAPDAFIPAAEESRLIIPLGKWVCQQACKQHRLWQQQGLPALNMSVNLSGVQFESNSLEEDIVTALEQENVDPQYVTLEVTESILMSAQSASSRAIAPIETMESLSELGIKIAIDDFGTGYSSLAYLKKLPVHLVKIDRAFIDGLPNDQEDIAITTAILSMSKALKLNVVAEGIETAEQLAYLQNEHCDFAQGYYLAKPMPADQFELFFKACGGIAANTELDASLEIKSKIDASQKISASRTTDVQNKAS